jgi:hypothetical protein
VQTKVISKSPVFSHTTTYADVNGKYQNGYVVLKLMEILPCVGLGKVFNM